MSFSYSPRLSFQYFVIFSRSESVRLPFNDSHANDEDDVVKKRSWERLVLKMVILLP